MIYQFDNCTFDTQRFELSCAGQPVALRRKAFQLLTYLLLNGDRVVPKDELVDHLWPDQFIGDAALNSCLREVRRAISDNGQAQRIIRTIRGSGYRIVVPILIENHALGTDSPGIERAAPELTVPPVEPEMSLSRHDPSCQHVSPIAAPSCNAYASPLHDSHLSYRQALLPEAHLCHHCGTSIPTMATDASPQLALDVSTPLTPGAIAVAERRHLSVMFCDLVDSTALASQLDPEDLRDIVQAYQGVCAEIISRFDGYIAQYLGDGILVYFGYPQAHEDDAHRAVRAGLEIIEAIQAVEIGSRQYNHQLSVRIGVHTGLVVIGEMGGGDRQERLALGEVPNVASRLQALAQPDTLMISAETHRLTQVFFICESLGDYQLIGLGHPIGLYRVMQISEAQSRFDVVSAKGLVHPLVGRASEVDLLLDRWRQASAGFAQVVVLSSEAGIGKSRLVQVVKDEVALESHTLVACRCSAYHQQSTLHAVLDPLRRLLQWQESDTADIKLAKLKQVLEQLEQPLPTLVPPIAALLSLPLPEGRYPSIHLSREQQRATWLEAILTLILALAKHRPVLFIVEDLHWIDPTTRELLDLLMTQDSSVRLLTVLTCRPEFRVPWVIRDHLTHLTLNRLTPIEVEHMVLQLTDDIPLPMTVLEQWPAQADGVPLFIEEMVKTIFESGFLKLVDDHYELSDPIPNRVIPTTLHSALMSRLDRLRQGKSVAQKVSKKGGVGGPVALASGYENTYPLPNRPE